jgi:hypothetical protein
MTFCALVLGALAADPADAGCGPMPVAQPTRSFCIECVCTKAGAGGKEKCIARPVLMTLDGGTVTFISGGHVAVRMADADGTVGLVPFGLSVRAKVKGLDQAKVRVDATVETTEREQTGPDDIRLQGNMVHAILSAKLGDVVKLVQKGPDGKAQHAVKLKITEVPQPTAAVRPAAAEGAAGPGVRPAGWLTGAARHLQTFTITSTAGRNQPPAPAAETAQAAGSPCPARRLAASPVPAPTLAEPPVPAERAPGVVGGLRGLEEPPAPAGACTPAPAVSTVPPAPPAVPHANDVHAEAVDGHPGLIRLTTLLHAAARDGSAAPPIPVVQYVCVPTSVHQLQRLAHHHGTSAGAADTEQKLDRILERLAAVEQRLGRAEQPASAPADKGQASPAPTGCYGTGAEPINLDFGFPTPNFQLWMGTFH